MPQAFLTARRPLHNPVQTQGMNDDTLRHSIEVLTTVPGLSVAETWLNKASECSGHAHAPHLMHGSTCLWARSSRNNHHHTDTRDGQHAAAQDHMHALSPSPRSPRLLRICT